jgi:hypothetical protein
MKPKTTLVPGGYPAELVARGEVEMIVDQISEIVPVKGVTWSDDLRRLGAWRKIAAWRTAGSQEERTAWRFPAR